MPVRIKLKPNGFVYTPIAAKKLKQEPFVALRIDVITLLIKRYKKVKVVFILL